ncbi:type 1 glutamine amidotransferase domain-containing protein [Demequina globuliformis]|uniref:type 1 glutamine amidotransferase domain-containing protein n=1 Tax=Demequina globuliformis TaxID=676202 RepID=UPI0007825E40|nr:type 1 glutamine amidotransferase domain-containing protein [Demequina globuliformis]
MTALVIATNYGVEQDEILGPIKALKAAGIPVTIAAPSTDPIQTLVGDKDPGEKVEPNLALADVEADGYDVLVIPGGTINADTLRTDEDAQALVKQFADGQKTVAAICHGPWILTDAQVVTGKTLTSYPSLQTDLTNAGATWVDEELFECEALGWTLLTSRTPDDLDAFNAAVVKAAS